MLQVASSRKSSKPGSVISPVISALGGAFSVASKLVVAAGRDAADAEVAALDEAERVVEHDLVLLPESPRRRSRAASTAAPRADQHHEADRDQPPHGTFPVARCVSSQSRNWRSSAESTFEPSEAGSSAAPGQRLNWSCLGGPRPAAGSPWPGTAGRAGELLEGDQAAGVRAERVEAAAGGGEVVQPADEVLGVGPAGGDDRRRVAERLAPTPGTRPARFSPLRCLVSTAMLASGGPS